MTEVKKVWLNPSKRVPIDTQLKAAKAWGVTDRRYDMWNAAEGVKIWEVIDSMREGEWLGVYQAHLLSPGPNKKKKETGGMVFDRIAIALVDAGIRIYEIKTKRSCGTKRELVRMMVEAKQALSKNSGGNKAAKGRPKKYAFTIEQLKTIAAVWNGKDHRNNGQRIAALRALSPDFADFQEQDYYRNREKIIAVQTEEHGDG